MDFVINSPNDKPHGSELCRFRIQSFSCKMTACQCAMPAPQRGRQVACLRAPACADTADRDTHRQARKQAKWQKNLTHTDLLYFGYSCMKNLCRSVCVRGKKRLRVVSRQIRNSISGLSGSEQ